MGHILIDWYILISETPGRLTFPISTGIISLTTSINRNKCKRWVNQQRYRVDSYQQRWNTLPDCPCSAWFLLFDRRFQFVRWWTVTSDTFSSSILPFWWSLPFGKVCNLLLTYKAPPRICSRRQFQILLLFQNKKLGNDISVRSLVDCNL